jgi:hypothetical protein
MQGSKIKGLAIFPFIFVRNRNLKNHKVLINHERIHLRQQLELLLLPFYVLYICEYLYRRYIQQNNHNQAYKLISFEQEASQNETNLNYLKNRKLFSFLSYF